MAFKIYEDTYVLVPGTKGYLCFTCLESMGLFRDEVKATLFSIMMLRNVIYVILFLSSKLYCFSNTF